VQGKRSQQLPSTLSENTKASFLAQNDIFRHLSADEIQELDRLTTVIACPAGRVFYRPGETGHVLFLLKEGRVQLYHLSTDGRKLITATLETGACFGEMPLIGQGMYNSFAEAVEDSRICVMSKHDVEHLLSHKPAVTLALLQIVGQRLVQLETQLINATFMSSQARLAALLLQLAQPAQHTSRVQPLLVVAGLSQEELAERLGVYRETVNGALRELREAGAIVLGRKHITITNAAYLEEIAAS
jgi:CRP-like cAMP-binding protein